MKKVIFSIVMMLMVNVNLFSAPEHVPKHEGTSIDCITTDIQIMNVSEPLFTCYDYAVLWGSYFISDKSAESICYSIQKNPQINPVAAFQQIKKSKIYHVNWCRSTVYNFI